IAEQAWKEVSAANPIAAAEVAIDDLPTARGDANLLRQVLVNLLSNAVKFSRDAESPRIHVGARRENGAVVYYVEDKGCGFDMRHADKLFKVFQRLHRREEYEGSGVGLALVHNIIRRHGGRVWADAERGRGATFYFTLPAQSNATQANGGPVS
ncbi:MAG: GHKL domain-containing protein, partial [Candidatus Hydrogenedentes bacterium]|nr:GHKL domain-containing protein [Candidatus Hydrogenedentota bacterium]